MSANAQEIAAQVNAAITQLQTVLDSDRKSKCEEAQNIIKAIIDIIHNNKSLSQKISQFLNETLSQMLEERLSSLLKECSEKDTTTFFFNHEDVVGFLLKNGARIDFKGNIKHNVLHILANHLTDECWNLLSNQSTIQSDVLYKDGNTPLTYAISEKNNKVVDFLLKQGANPNQCDQYGCSPLGHAMFLKNNDAIQLLLKVKADVHFFCKAMPAPLTYAIQLNMWGLVNQLVRYGASLFSLKKTIWAELQKEYPKEMENLLQLMSQQFSQETEVKKLIENLTCADIKNIPFHRLKMDAAVMKDLNNRMLVLLQTEKLNSMPKVQQRLIDILLNHEKWALAKDAIQYHTLPLVQTLNLLNVVAELAEIICKPYSIHQGDNTLCGPASILTLLAKNDPERLVTLSLDLVMQGETREAIVLNLSAYSKTQAIDLVDVLLTEIKRSSKGLWTTYSPTSSLASVQGYTSTKSMCSWLERFGYDDIHDLTLMLEEDGQVLSKPKQALLYMAFQNFHAHKNEDAVLLKENNLKGNLENVIARRQKNQEVMLLLSGDLMDRISFSNTLPPRYRPEKGTNTVLGIASGHFVCLQQGNVLEDPQGGPQHIHMEIMTWGRRWSFELPLEEFLHGYRGAIVATPPSILKPRLKGIM